MFSLAGRPQETPCGVPRQGEPGPRAVPSAPVGGEDRVLGGTGRSCWGNARLMIAPLAGGTSWLLGNPSATETGSLTSLIFLCLVLFSPPENGFLCWIKAG